MQQDASDTPSAIDTLRSWFIVARPPAEHALAQVDDARARGAISREEYLSLLDAWPESA